MTLTGKQRVFIDEYLKTFNATQAAIKAGYSENSARSIGSENLTKPNIKAEIDARLAEITMSANEVLVRLTQAARLDVDDLYDFIGGLPVFNPDKARERGVLHLVQGFEITDKSFKVKLPDAMAAQIQIGKYHSLFVERQDLTSGGEKLSWPSIIKVVKPDDET